MEHQGPLPVSKCSNCIVTIVHINILCIPGKCSKQWTRMHCWRGSWCMFEKGEVDLTDRKNSVWTSIARCCIRGCSCRRAPQPKFKENKKIEAVRLRKWLWTDSAANASEHNDYCWWRGKKNDLAKRGILSHFINVLSCYCTLLCSQPFVIFNYLCLPCDCIFPQVFSVLLIVFATNIISFLFWDWGFTQHTQQRECAHMQSKPPRASTPANFQTQFISLQTWTGRYFPSPNKVTNAMCQTEPQTKLDSDHLNWAWALF